MVPRVSLALSELQCAWFREHGFLALDRITSPDEVDRLRTIFERLFEHRAGRDRGLQYDMAGTDEDDKPAGLPQIMCPSKLEPELLKTEFMDNARSIARQIIGPEADFVFDHALLKPAHHGTITPWHQDEAFSDPQWDLNQVSFWMPLQPATADNGCLHFIGGSHRGDVLPHRPYQNDPRIHALECYQGFDPIEEVVCPLPAGGATLHHSRTLHSSGPNQTARSRFAYVLVFGAPAVRHPVPREFPWNANRETARQRRECDWLRSQPWWQRVQERVDRKVRRIRRALNPWGSQRVSKSS
jgi:ectoine hydroxylase-related dioxygenase (phytanoyl-CoA dioxygenase family)